MKEYFCILGGGGIRGGAYCGALTALKQAGVKITGLGGSSVGAIVAGLIDAGYCSEKIEEIFENIDFGIFKDINLDFKKGFGLSKGENFYEWIKQKIGSKCFGQLNRELVIFAADVASSKFYEFSKTKTPEVEIAYAIRASVGMPGLYAPVYNGGECLIDGDILKSMPLWEASSTIKQTPGRILEFRLENNETKKEISNGIDYLNAVYDTLTGFATDYIIKKYKNYDRYDFIKINLENVSVVDFMASKEKKREMVKKGYDTTIRYFNVDYLKKSKFLFEQYQELFGGFEKISFLIANKKYKQAQYELSNSIAQITPNKEILDEKLLDEIINFKKNLDGSLIEKTGFFRLKPALLNPKQISLNAEKILKFLKQKTDYFSSAK